MPAISSNTNEEGLGFARHEFTGTAWEELTFDPWVARVGIRTLSGTVYVSRDGEGAFSAAGTNYNTIAAADGQFIAELNPQNPALDRAGSLRLAHSDGASGVVELELLG